MIFVYAPLIYFFLSLFISIHAPREGSDYAYNVNKIEVLPGTLGQLENQSNPTGNPSILGIILLQDIRDSNGHLVLISIHAPREGSDIIQEVFKESLKISIHAPREGSDHR